MIPEVTPRKPNRGAKGGRVRVVASRVSEEEYVHLSQKARDAGLKIGGYLRACGLGNPGLRARRSPPLNAELLAYAVAQLNRVGNNLNQLNRRLNGVHPVGATAAQVLSELRATIRQICDSLGHRERHDREGQHTP